MARYVYIRPVHNIGKALVILLRGRAGWSQYSLLQLLSAHCIYSMHFGVSVSMTFAASHPLSTEPLKQSRCTVVVDTTLFFRFTSASTLTRRFPKVSFVAKYVHGNVGTVS